MVDGLREAGRDAGTFITIVKNFQTKPSRFFPPLAPWGGTRDFYIPAQLLHLIAFPHWSPMSLVNIFLQFSESMLSAGNPSGPLGATRVALSSDFEEESLYPLEFIAYLLPAFPLSE